MRHLAVILIVLSTLTLAGCGGGGSSTPAASGTTGGSTTAGGGTTGGGAPNPNLVTIGTVQFDTTTSTDFSHSYLDFPLSQVQHLSLTNYLGTNPRNYQYFATTTLPVPNQPALAVITVDLPSNTPGQPVSTGYWAVGTDGALYAVTQYAPSAATPVLLSQPWLVVPSNADLVAGYTNANATYGIEFGLSQVTRILTVVATNVTSPQGLPGCTHITVNAATPSTGPGGTWSDTIDEYFQPGNGPVEMVITPGEQGQADDLFRNDISSNG